MSSSSVYNVYSALGQLVSVEIGYIIIMCCNEENI